MIMSIFTESCMHVSRDFTAKIHIVVKDIRYWIAQVAPFSDASMASKAQPVQDRLSLHVLEVCEEQQKVQENLCSNPRQLPMVMQQILVNMYVVAISLLGQESAPKLTCPRQGLHQRPDHRLQMKLLCLEENPPDRQGTPHCQGTIARVDEHMSHTKEWHAMLSAATQETGKFCRKPMDKGGLPHSDAHPHPPKINILNPFSVHFPHEEERIDQTSGVFRSIGCNLSGKLTTGKNAVNYAGWRVGVWNWQRFHKDEDILGKCVRYCFL